MRTGHQTKLCFGEQPIWVITAMARCIDAESANSLSCSSYPGFNTWLIHLQIRRAKCAHVPLKLFERKCPFKFYLCVGIPGSLAFLSLCLVNRQERDRMFHLVAKVALHVSAGETVSVSAQQAFSVLYSIRCISLFTSVTVPFHSTSKPTLSGRTDLKAERPGVCAF